MFEPDFESLIDQSRDNGMNNAIDWIAQASRAQQSKERDNDILQASKENTIKKLKTTSFFKKQPSLIYSFSEELVKSINSHIYERKKSELSELSSSIVETVRMNLEKIDSFEFNIFELNDVIDTKTMHYMTYEVFNRYNFFEELLDEKKYRNFIQEITNGYDRSVVYHNDLHAADVMQTVYVMIEKGNLVDVI